MEKRNHWLFKGSSLLCVVLTGVVAFSSIASPINVAYADWGNSIDSSATSDYGLQDYTDIVSTANVEKSVEQAIDARLDALQSGMQLSPLQIDGLMLYAEEKIAQRASIYQYGAGKNGTDVVVINESLLNGLQSKARDGADSIQKMFISKGLTIPRYFSPEVAVKTEATDKVTIKIDPSSTSVIKNNVRVDTQYFRVTVPAEFIRNIGDKTVTLMFTESSNWAEKKKMNNKKASSSVTNLDPVLGFELKVESSNKSIKGGVRISLPLIDYDLKDQAILNSDLKPIGSRLNPIINMLETNISQPGTYYVRNVNPMFVNIAQYTEFQRTSITTISNAGIISSTNGGYFMPNEPVLRGEMAVMLTNLRNNLDPTATVLFNDVAKDDWYYRAVATVKKTGLMKGSKGYFRPDTTITRGEFVAIMARILREDMNYVVPSGLDNYLSVFSDGAKISDWSRNDVSLMVRERLLMNMSGSFNQNEPITRLEAVMILNNVYKRLWY